MGLTDPFNAPVDGRLNGKVFSSRDRDNDEHAINCGKADGGWWHATCTAIEPNDRYGDKNLKLNDEWLIYTFMEIKMRPLNCHLLNCHLLY